MNILLTNYCNLKCPYCFARNESDYTKETKKKFIDLQDVYFIIKFLKKSKEKYVGIIGGEPTLHPHFNKIISKFICHDFFVNIFSNGIIKNSVIKFLNELNKKKWKMLLNINNLDSYSKFEIFSIDRTIGLLKSQIILGYNIYSINFNADHIIDYIEKYKLEKIIRLGIANPSPKHDNNSISLEEHRRIGLMIVRFAKKCNEHNISIDFDCGFTLCSFSKNDLGKLSLYGSPFQSICPGVIDVGIDLSVWRCFPTSSIFRKNLKDFRNLEEIKAFYRNKFFLFRSVGSTNKCFKCKRLILRECKGGCLGNTLKSFDVSYM